MAVVNYCTSSCALAHCTHLYDGRRGVLGVFIPVARHFFAFEWPSASLWLVIVCAGLCAGAVIEAFSRVLYLGRLREAEEEGRARD